MFKEIMTGVIESPTIWAVMLGALFVATGWVVKTTKTKKDDAIFAIINGSAFNAFNIAEKLIPDNVENKTIKKIDEALKAFNLRIVEALGRDATKPEIDQAKALWSELAFELKKK